MAFDTNSIVLRGTVGKDPELKKGDKWQLAKFTLAYSEWKKAKDSTPQNENYDQITTWFNVVCWNLVAEKVKKLVKKGSRVMLEGKVEINKGKDDKYYTNIKATSVEVLVEYKRPRKGSNSNSTSSQSTTQESAVNYDEDLPF